MIIRTINIDFTSTSDNIFVGYEGEHKQSTLSMKIPQDMVTGIESYTCEFQTSYNEKITYPVSTYNDGIATFELVQQLMLRGTLGVQVCGYNLVDSTPTLIAKTKIKKLLVEKSTYGIDTDSSSTADQDIWQEYIDNAPTYISGAPDYILVPLTSEKIIIPNSGTSFTASFSSSLIRGSTIISANVFTGAIDPNAATSIYTINISDDTLTLTITGTNAIDLSLHGNDYFYLTKSYDGKEYSKTIYVKYIYGTKGDTGATGASVTVDTVLSATSYNAIGNNAAYNAFQALESRMTEKTSYGVISGLVVSAQSTPNMTVQVSSGVAYIPPVGGITPRCAPAAVPALAISAANATYPRFDIVYINSSGTVSYLAGTAAASPVQPDTPSGGLLLAIITVLSGTTSITSTSIEIVKKSLWTEAWIAPTLVNGWTRVDDYPVRFKKNITNTVNLRGRVATGAAGTYIFLLPVGYRPIVITQLICAHGATGAIRIEIHPSGYVYCINSYTSYLDLSGISFYAE